MCMLAVGMLEYEALAWADVGTAPLVCNTVATNILQTNCWRLSLKSHP